MMLFNPLPLAVPQRPNPAPWPGKARITAINENLEVLIADESHVLVVADRFAAAVAVHHPPSLSAYIDYSEVDTYRIAFERAASRRPLLQAPSMLTG